MISESCLDELSKKSLICEFKIGGLVRRTVVRLVDDIPTDVILDTSINLSTDDLLSYEYWDSDNLQNEIKINNYVIDKKLRIDFLNKLLPKLESEFTCGIVLSTDKLKFVKEFFGEDLIKIKEFKINIINSFCDNIISEFSDSLDDDIKLIKQSLMDIKLDRLDRLKTADDVILYWPDLLYPNPLDV